MKRSDITLLGAALVAAWLGCAPPAHAGTLRERLQQKRVQSTQDRTVTLPAGARVLRDAAYGDDPRQRFDLYLPANAKHAPVIFMVHGGGWAFGDKTNRGVIDNKAAYWLPKGYALVSANYRMLPQAAPLEQARDVARALAKAQAMAVAQGADREAFLLMGHSAGAHLVDLLATSPRLLSESGATPVRGTVSLDSAALDVPQMMRGRHPPLYDRAFGDDPADWKAASPFDALAQPIAPMLIVCSTRRPDSCPQGRAFAAKAATFGARVELLPEDLTHGQINEALGLPSAYTDAVAAFVESLRHRVPKP